MEKKSRRKSKRKNRSSGGDSDGGHLQRHLQRRKTYKAGGPDEGSEGNISLSELLSQTNSVLFNEKDTHNVDSDKVSDNDDVFVPVSGTESGTESESNSSGENTAMEPSNKDIMNCLKEIKDRMTTMETRLGALEEVKEKVSGFESELKKLWVAVDKKNKQIDERLTRVEEKYESCDFSLDRVSSKIVDLENERDVLRREVVYLQGQSMRNNLVFSNLPEDDPETNEECERKVRDFIIDKMKVAKELVDKMRFERVHRMGEKGDGKKRNIVAKFLDFKDREIVRRNWKALKGTQYYVNEQFPREVVERRQKLLPRLKAARQAGKRAWLAYDRLYIDGVPVKD